MTTDIYRQANKWRKKFIITTGNILYNSTNLSALLKHLTLEYIYV